MTASCPYCFTPVEADRIGFRCVGACIPRPDAQASFYAGKSLAVPPVYCMIRNDRTKQLPTYVVCRRCGAQTAQEVCLVCHRDLPPRWRQARTFTMTVTGARDTGKSVYIAVVVQMLLRYAQQRSCTVMAYTQGTQDVYGNDYYEPLYHRNVVMEGTPSMTGGGAYQEDPLIWEIAGGDGGRFYLVMRDIAGEDLERLTGREGAFSFIDRADLVLFLFDPLMLDAVRKVLSGLIPDLDTNRKGVRPGEVLPKILAQMSSGGSRLALTICKFDALQQLPRANSKMAPVLANPAAHFNWDDTMVRARTPSSKQRVRALEEDGAFLDAEVCSMLRYLGEDAVTLQAVQAVRNRKIAALRHFVVSSLGETPQHREKLTERGISPFRVLDPILWGLSQARVEF
ncbi:hypothetical protein [Actinomyces massiliensis]|jgi:hypothetical protein|uniref:hypothetical protein n=1 Tax=Actinomyces massiliensis TaxID=461393 RepID=UPI0023550B48|nr:hypothetical protein [Actinomyces massiliensis]